MVGGRVEGVEVVVRGIYDLNTRTKGAAYIGVMNALAIAEKASREIISASDHSLAELAKMGHPYAARDPRNPHVPPETIHTQKGDYLRALTVTRPQGTATSITSGRVTIEGAMKQRDLWLQMGTRKMIARPWMAEVMRTQGPAMRQAILATITAAIAPTAA